MKGRDIKPRRGSAAVRVRARAVTGPPPGSKRRAHAREVERRRRLENATFRLLRERHTVT
jgi:hypothetical protein